MTAEIKISEAGQSTSSSQMPEKEQEFNWRQCWYPITFVEDLPKDRPYSFTLYDEPLVLFRNKDEQLVCLIDLCPHRAAKLSDGQIIDGKIECLYHGWQFGKDGQCLHIPQLPDEAKIPPNSCVKSFIVVECQGMIWMWAGEADTADDKLIPTIAELDKPEFVSTNIVRDLNYDQQFFIENVVDTAHVNISHAGTQGKRENAQPLEMEVIESSKNGFLGRLRGTREPNKPWSPIEFIAPNFVIYRFSIPQKNWAGGLALYSIPLGKGRCRVLARNYRNFMTWKVKLTPRWLDHMFRNKLLEEDLPLVVGAEKQIERLGQNLKEVYLPLKTCDVFVLEYRKWLDKFGSSLPYYHGYSTSKNVVNGECDRQPISLNRIEEHTHICSSCNQAYKVTNRLVQIFVGVAIALAALAIITDGSKMQIALVLASLGAVVSAASLGKLKTHFERYYTRK
jgi:phenylpropionate dioxygenase-like ring-hydroxylating dioxygenase large terminal subunit